MAFGRDLPESYSEAVSFSKKLLGRSEALVARGTIETEAEQIVMAAHRAVSGQALSRMELYAKCRDRMLTETAEKVLVMSLGRAEGQPLQHLTGVQQFLSHEYEVGPDVLVPRPETEVLVQTAIDRLAPHQRELELGLEIGLGSGVISIELLSRFPMLRMISSELSSEARMRTGMNAGRILGTSWPARLKMVAPAQPTDVLGALLTELDGRLADFLISNPPYLSPGDAIDDEVLRHEPGMALFAPGGDALLFYREIASQGAGLLKEGASAFLELPHERDIQVRDLFKNKGWVTLLLPDLTGRGRVLVARQAQG